MLAVGILCFGLVAATFVTLAAHEYGARIGDTNGVIGWALGFLVATGSLFFALATL